ncbi:MAG: threonine synthase [Acidihalobacter sp.]
MNFIETRGNDDQRPAQVSFSQAILSPMSSFGGIYVPERLPTLDIEFLRAHLEGDYKTLARDVLASFELDIDPALIDEALALYDGFDDPANPVPVMKVRDDLYVSELYHGPTRAFKDMALQPFGVVLSALAKQRGEQYLIMAATSGDTGPATLETFKDRPNVKVACLYPDGGTSDVQRLQMVTEDAANLKVIGIHGDFDDAQSALKRLLGSEAFRTKLKERHTHLSAANSVNFGRIIFQLIYHIHSYLELVRQSAIALGDKVYFDVPSGNFGNALGGYYAMRMGLPVEKILIASNRNNILTDLIRTGRYDMRSRELIATSDLYGAERTRELMRRLDEERHYELSTDELDRLQEVFAADWCDDDTAKGYIRKAFDAGYLMDPHTATCFKAYDTCRTRKLATIAYSTAEWTKFSPTIANALTGEVDAHDIDALKTIATQAETPIPARIQALFDKPVAQGGVVDKADIEDAVLSFI